MDAAFENELEVSALHNHFFFDEPKVTSCTSAATAILSSSPPA